MRFCSRLEFTHGRAAFASCSDVVLERYIHGVKECVEKLPTDAVWRLPVELVCGFEHVDVGQKHLGSLGELLVGGVEALLQGLALEGDCREARFQFFGGEFAVGGQVEQIIFLDSQALQLLRQVCPQFAFGALRVFKSGGNVGAENGGEVFVEGVPREFFLNGDLDFPDGEKCLLAVPLLSSAADEVFIGPSIARDLEIRQPRLDASVVALAAEQEAAEVMIVDPVTLPASSALSEHILDLQE